MRTYKTPFSAAFWREAALQLKSTRTLTVCAILMALSVAVGSFFIPLPNGLRVYFTFLPKALCAMICGPLAAVMFGLAEDLLGVMLHPSGPFFIGYTISSMVGMLIYALGLFRGRISLVRVAAVKLCVNLLCNVALGALWSSMLYGKAYLFYLGSSLVKNLLLWPAESLLIFLVFRLVADTMVKQKLIPPQPHLKKQVRRPPQ